MPLHSRLDVGQRFAEEVADDVGWVPRRRTAEHDLALWIDREAIRLVITGAHRFLPDYVQCFVKGHGQAIEERAVVGVNLAAAADCHHALDRGDIRPYGVE